MASAIGPALLKTIVPPDAHFRSFEPNDLAWLKRLYPAAFPDEDLLPLVCELSASPKLVTGWVVEVDNKVVGHIAFTKCAVGSDEAVFLLGPLAVSPKLQRKGLGKKLIELGLSDLAARNASMVFVLGDPAYYSRSGFLAERVVMPPFVLPAEWDGAWQSLKIDQSVEPVSAKLVVPPVWDKKALWSG